MNTNQTNWQTENKFYHASYRILSCQDSWSTKQINHTHTVLPCTTALTSLLAAWLAVLAGWLIGWLACCLAGWLAAQAGRFAGWWAGRHLLRGSSFQVWDLQATDVFSGLA